MQVGFSLNQFKSMFFDRSLVEGKIDRTTFLVMGRIGAMIRQTARRGFRRKTAKQVVPGKPPRNLTDKLRGAILFGWDPVARSEVIGPWLFPRQRQSEPATFLLEHSGDTTRTQRGKTVTAHYRAFPYMQPALEKEMPRLAGLWRDTIR